jgi:hypothetical protein
MEEEEDVDMGGCFGGDDDYGDYGGESYSSYVPPPVVQSAPKPPPSTL